MNASHTTQELLMFGMNVTLTFYLVISYARIAYLYQEYGHKDMLVESVGRMIGKMVNHCSKKDYDLAGYFVCIWAASIVILILLGWGYIFSSWSHALFPLAVPVLFWDSLYLGQAYAYFKS